MLSMPTLASTADLRENSAHGLKGVGIEAACDSGRYGAAGGTAQPTPGSGSASCCCMLDETLSEIIKTVLLVT